MAADRALVNLLHAERIPLHIGNAIMRDLATAPGLRQESKSAADVAALKPLVNQLLEGARTNAALNQMLPAGATAEQLIAGLGRDTVVALRGLIDYRALPRR